MDLLGYLNKIGLVKMYKSNKRNPSFELLLSICKKENLRAADVQTDYRGKPVSLKGNREPTSGFVNTKRKSLAKRQQTKFLVRKR